MPTEETLVLNNIGLVGSIVKKFHPRTKDDYEDYMQVGTIGLLKAIRKFDKIRRNHLSTIACPYIYYHILSYVIANINTTLPLKDYAPIYNHNTPIWEFLPNNLTPKERNVVQLKIVEQYSLAEIGRLMGGYSRCWIHKLYKSALKKIRKSYELNV